VMRTHAAGTLRADHAGTPVTLAGWVARRRDHGGVAFLDLRDASGVVQVVVRDETLAASGAHDLRNEYCIQVTGVVEPRPVGNANPDLPTGEVEVVAAELEVLSPSAPTPFQIDERVSVGEETRLKYRYLDLRRPGPAAAIRLRSEVNRVARTLLAERSPESQRFLASLATHRLELGPELRTGPLLHSERFILEAMDGFRVEEVTAEAEARQPADRAAEEPPSVLIAKGTAGPRPQPPLGSGVFLENRDYLLFQSASQIAGRTARSPRHGRGHIGRRPRLWRPRSRVYPT